MNIWRAFSSIHCLTYLFPYLGVVMTPQVWIYLFLLLSATAYGVYNFRDLTLPYRLLIAQVFLVLLSEITSQVIRHFILSSFPVYYVLIPALLLFNSLIYRTLFKSSIVLKEIVTIVAIILLVIHWYLSLCTSEVWTESFPSISLMLLSLFTISVSLLVFIQMLYSPIMIPLQKQAIFWWNSGNLFFYSVTFFIFGYFRYIKGLGQNMPEWSYTQIWLASMVMYSCHFTSLYFNRKKSNLKNGNDQ